MDRFQLAIRKHNAKPIAYRFKSTSSLNKLCSYLKKCIEDGVIFDAKDVQSGILDAAIVRIGKETNTPILVDSDKIARSLSIAHSYKMVYSLEKEQKFSYIKYPYALYYMEQLPLQDVNSPKPLLIIQK
jgi:uncharacterized protein YehS (DUF1456 family)